MEDSHAKDCDQPADEGCNNYSDDNTHAATTDGRKDLAGNDGSNDRIPNHQNHVKDGG
jgi:hypothetical protein